MMTDEIILEVKNLSTYFHTEQGQVKAVDHVSFVLRDGETLGIVGESGSGKTVLNLSILRLLPSSVTVHAGGQILYRGRDMMSLNESELQQIRGNKISMIFQDPMTSLNPYMKVCDQLMETLILHQGLDKKTAKEKSVELIKHVGIPDPKIRAEQYPHQFSGGMRQRVMIAMALSCKPDILIADEPTTALDVTIQAQILDLIRELTREMKTSVILITHDLGVVAGICDTVAVMYAGRIVEYGTVDEIFSNPRHPYTQGLIQSVPRLDGSSDHELFSIPGSPPSLVNLPAGCHFQPRCSKAMPICAEKYPPEIVNGNHRCCCWLWHRGEDRG
jgi:oligopeptide transport system ATP-binding protein